MKHNCNGEHHWSGLPHAESLSARGTRKIYDCNNCLAIKVEFYKDIAWREDLGKMEVQFLETIVEDVDT